MVLDDEWTVITTDGSRAAHWEHTVAVTDDGPRILARCLSRASTTGLDRPEQSDQLEPIIVRLVSRAEAEDGGSEDHETTLMRVLYDEHAAALWRYAVRLTGDARRAEDVVQETLLRAWQHPEVTEDTERSARAWLFTVARNMIIDERRSARFRKENGRSNRRRNPSSPARRGRRRTGQAAVGDAMAQLSDEHRAVIRRSYYRGWTTAQIAAGPADRRRNRKIAPALRGAGAAPRPCRKWG